MQKVPEVLTAGGLIGKITKVTEGSDSIVIALNDTTEITINRNYIVSVLPKGSLKSLLRVTLIIFQSHALWLCALERKRKTMLNRYPLWKNLMVIFIVAIGILYSLPNIYGEDPAVQISGTRGQEANTSVFGQVQDVLKTNNLPTKSIVLENGSILARFTNTDDQLLAKDKIAERLGNNYTTTALNLAPATQLGWYVWCESYEMGIRLYAVGSFLMEVDMNAALVKRQEQLQDSLRGELRKEKFNILPLKNTEHFGTLITLANVSQRVKAERIIRQLHPTLDITEPRC